MFPLVGKCEGGSVVTARRVMGQLASDSTLPRPLHYRPLGIDGSESRHYNRLSMGGLIAIIAIITVFGAPTYIFKRMLDLREKRLELENGARLELESGAMKDIAAMREENKQLQARLELLEETVMSGDFELNQKLKEIALKETATASLPEARSEKLGTGK